MFANWNLKEVFLLHACVATLSMEFKKLAKLNTNTYTKYHEPYESK
jgi:hypothetical protein